MDDPEPAQPDRPPRSAALRIAAAIAVAIAFAGGVYALLEATQPSGGLVSFTFLLILPAAVSAFVAYVADPWRTRTRGQYLMIPVWVLLAVIVISIFFLREGTICIVLLSPLWLLGGLAGAWATYRVRHINDHGRTYCTALLVLPLVAVQVEPAIPLPVESTGVTRSVVIAADPAAIWPMLRGIPDVHAGEGRWNLTQDVIGIPRPVAARLVGEGRGATRFADWGPQIRFREHITEWQAERRIGWRFAFDDMAGWAATDRHLLPDSPYFRITTGGYRMEPLSPGHTRLTLDTRYILCTPVNAYSRAWGELLLGDIENNLLAIIKTRAEHRIGAPDRLSAADDS